MSSHGGLGFLVQGRNDGFAPDLGHDSYHGVAEVLLLLFLRPDEHVVLREALDELQLVDAEHPHRDVHDAVGEHELLDLPEDGAVVDILPPAEAGGFLDASASACSRYARAGLTNALQFGDAPPKDVLCRVFVPVVDRPAPRANPLAVGERQRVVLISAVAELRGWKPPVNLVDGGPIFRCDVLQHIDKARPAEVVDLPSPVFHPGHTGNAQVLDEQVLVLPADVVGRLIEPVTAFVSEFGIDTVQLPAISPIVIGPSRGFGRQTLPLAYLAQEPFIELRSFYLRPVGEGHKGLEAEVNSRGCTRVCLSALHGFGVRHHEDVPLAARAEHPDIFDLPFPFPGLEELKAFGYLVYDEFVAIQLESILLENERRELLRPAELRGPAGYMLEKQPERSVLALEKFLYRLRVQPRPCDALREMLLHSDGIDISSFPTEAHGQ